MADPLVAEGYHVRRWLGQEPWGQAHLVVDDSGAFFTAKALELPRLGIAAPDPEDPDFQRLVSAIRAVSHPGVLNVHDVIVRDGLVYLFENYLHDQRDLREEIDDLEASIPDLEADRADLAAEPPGNWPVSSATGPIFCMSAASSICACGPNAS